MVKGAQARVTSISYPKLIKRCFATDNDERVMRTFREVSTAAVLTPAATADDSPLYESSNARQSATPRPRRFIPVKRQHHRLCGDNVTDRLKGECSDRKPGTC